MFPTRPDSLVQKTYENAKETYAAFGINVDDALARLEKIPVSLHCWQGDDVGGFESSEGLTGGGIQVTGNYPGKARNADELRGDLDKTYSLIPGKHRINLHTIYAETGGKKVERNQLQPEHFDRWIDWAKSNGLGMDFNPSPFSHPLANDGFSLSSLDAGVRKYWIEHCIAARRIGEHMGRKIGAFCTTNIWIPDGYKDIPIDRHEHRRLLKESLDAIFAEKIDPKYNLDAVESKLFGIGSESCVIGSHEFYLGYAVSRGKVLTLDMGHFHPTEVVSDKLSSVLEFLDRVLLHVSRGIRWDSDHVVIVSDELRTLAAEIIRNKYQDRISIGLDFFDGSINRIAAWVIGMRAMLKTLLYALLEPTDTLRGLEQKGDFTSRLALLEEAKSLPADAVWDYYCMKHGVPVGIAWLNEVKKYETDVLSKRK